MTLFRVLVYTYYLQLRPYHSWVCVRTFIYLYKRGYQARFNEKRILIRFNTKINILIRKTAQMRVEFENGSV